MKYEYGSFQAKIGRKRMRNWENKNYGFVSFRSYQTRRRKFQKNFKNVKIPLWIHFKPKLIGEG